MQAVPCAFPCPPPASTDDDDISNVTNVNTSSSASVDTHGLCSTRIPGNCGKHVAIAIKMSL